MLGAFYFFRQLHELTGDKVGEKKGADAQKTREREEKKNLHQPYLWINLFFS